MTPPKPVRAYAIVNAKGQTILVSVRCPDPEWCDMGERIIRGRFVPDAKKARKGRNADRS